jgi:hypothetical protein
MASTANHDCRSSRRRLRSGRRNRCSRSRARVAFTKIVADSSVTTRSAVAAALVRWSEYVLALIEGCESKVVMLHA